MARQYKQVLVDPPGPLVLIRLPEWAKQQGLWKRLLSRLWQSEGDQNGIGQPIEEQEEPLWIRMEEHLRR